MTQKQKNTHEQVEAIEVSMLPASQITQDLKNAVLIVSVVANLFIFTAWVALQVTTQFDSQIATFLFNR